MLGPISPEELGFTQCHEHLLLSKGESYRQNPALWMDDVESSIKEAKVYRERGGSALVEAQPVGRTGVNIVASTGYHKRLF